MADMSICTCAIVLADATHTVIIGRTIQPTFTLRTVTAAVDVGLRRLKRAIGAGSRMGRIQLRSFHTSAVHLAYAALAVVVFDALLSSIAPRTQTPAVLCCFVVVQLAVATMRWIAVLIQRLASPVLAACLSGALLISRARLAYVLCARAIR
jgi:hypothetical protein